MAKDNRYFERVNNRDSQDFDKNEILLKILQSEFPDDYLIQSGRLEHNAKEETMALTTEKAITKVQRSPEGIIFSTNSREEYVEISTIKSVPTVDDEELDEIIDEEYEFFLDEDVPVEPIPITGEFYMKPLSPLNPVDYHDLYIRRGPATIGERTGPLQEIINDTFCVYYIQSGIARPIPNYKTLEVMLVERSLTYSDIKIAGEEEILQFDMNLDGDFVGDPTANDPADPVEEFRFRQLDDRSFQWSDRIRFESGYIPGGEFKRDPGDYLKAPTLGINLTQAEREEAQEIYIDEDPEDRYYDRVFQGRTYKEKLREKFEGKMIIAQWPTDSSGIELANLTSNFTLATRFDDLSRTLRMMVSGYWKQVTDIDTINVYAYINDIDISDKRVIIREGQTEILVDQFIEERGALNQLVLGGGVTALQEDVQDAETLPVWNDFPHIAEVDALDKSEYEEYIDNFIDPFDVEYLKPYEPPGSIKYYNKVKVLELQEQAQAQARLNEIKEALIELTTDIGPKVAELNQILSLGNDLDGAYITNGIGAGADIYNILNADSNYEWIKKRNNGNVKVKTKKQSIMKVIGKDRVKRTISDRDRIEELADALGIDFTLNDRTEARSRSRNIPKAVKQDEYNGINLAGTYDDLYERAETIKDEISSARGSLNQLNEVLADVDNVLTQSTDPTEVDDAYNTIVDLLNELRNTTDILEEAQEIRTTMDKVRRQYVEECYKFVQKVRKAVNNNNGKYAIKWSSEAKKIINAYIPGKDFSNYLPDGVE